MLRRRKRDLYGQIFHTGTGPLAGTEDSFPGPDNPSKMRRSVENAEHVGTVSLSRELSAMANRHIRLVRPTCRSALPR